MSDSDAPLTDAGTLRYRDKVPATFNGCQLVNRDFARGLERALRRIRALSRGATIDHTVAEIDKIAAAALKEPL